MLKEFKSILSFFTRIPIYVDDFAFEEVANYFYLVVLVGYIIGSIGMFFACLFDYVFPTMLSAAIVLFIVEYINGFHHIDGLIDFGDGWMAVGDKKKKLMAMRDRYIGCGGVVFSFFINLISIISLSYVLEINVLYVIVMEVCAKIGMLSCSTFGKPLMEGTGRYFVKKSDEKFLTIGIILALPLLLIFNTVERKIVIISIVIAIITGLCIAKVAKNHFGGVNGDVLGASNEIARSIVLISIVGFIKLFTVYQITQYF